MGPGYLITVNASPKCLLSMKSGRCINRVAGNPASIHTGSVLGLFSCWLGAWAVDRLLLWDRK